jgi:nucleotide-binding universal stress UspA family protein
LGADDWLLMLPFFFASPLAMELLKVVLRRRQARPAGDGLDALSGPTVSPVGGVDVMKTMKRVLVPIAETGNDRFALREVVRRFVGDSAMEMHLLIVQTPFPVEVARFISRRSRDDWYRERAVEALRPAREMLDRHSIPYATHTVVADRAHGIVEAARRLECDEIVMTTARKNSLTRLVESSVTDRCSSTHRCP